MVINHCCKLFIYCMFTDKRYSFEFFPFIFSILRANVLRSVDKSFPVTGLSFFKKTLELYHCEHKKALAIQEKRDLGLLLVDKTQLKEKLVSSPLRCLEVRTHTAFYMEFFYFETILHVSQPCSKAET